MANPSKPPASTTGPAAQPSKSKPPARAAEPSILDKIEAWDIDEERSTLIKAAGEAPDAPPRAKDSVFPPAEAPTLRMPAPNEVGPKGGLPSKRPPPPLRGRTSGAPPASMSSPPAAPAQAPAAPPPSSSVIDVTDLSDIEIQDDSTPVLPRPPPVPAAPRSEPRAADRADKAALAHLADLLEARSLALAAKDGKTEDRLALARAHLEHALVAEILVDLPRAMSEAESALKVEPGLAAAHALLRRLRHARGAARALLDHLDREIAASVSDAVRADLWAEKARLLEAAGEKHDVVRGAWEQALAIDPRHPAALRGLEAVLAAHAGEKSTLADRPPQERLASHLARMAEAYASEPRLAAWLHVERARLLDKKLHDKDGARGALAKAFEIALAAGDGADDASWTAAVRGAAIRHAARHADAPTLVDLLEAESKAETEPARCARLELDAAMIALAKLDDVDRATGLLERARRRAPTAPLVDRRVLDELVRLHDAKGNEVEAAAARRQRLPLVNDPRAEAYELRVLAALAERAGDLEAALRDAERALSLDSRDPTIVDTVDRLLQNLGRHDRRAALWADHGAKIEDPAKRAKVLVRAAHVAEALGKRDDAIAQLRAALAAAPADAEVLETLTRLLTAEPSEPHSAEARARIALYAHAGERAADAARKVSYLERAALLWEEVIGDAALAARTFEQILSLDRDRRTAIVGLQRTAARAGDDRALSRALLDEARISREEPLRIELTVRAAQALSKIDPERALGLVGDVLKRENAPDDARALEIRLHEDAGRWELAARAIGARVAQASDPSAKVSLYLARAEIEQFRLKQPEAALASLRAARALDPSHPVPPEAIPRLLESTGDAKGLRAALVELADRAPSNEDKVRYLARAAEIDELLLGDDMSAASLYGRALEHVPDEELLLDRFARVVTRTGLHTDPHGRLDGGPAARKFDRAMVLVEGGGDPQKALSLLDSVIAREPAHVPALRTVEGVARSTGALPVLASSLEQQVEAFRTPGAKLGALWTLAYLAEWKLPESGDASTYARILQLAAADRAALDAILRRTMPLARKGDGVAKQAATQALLALMAHAGDDTTRLALHLALAFLAGPAGNVEASDLPAATTKAALEHYRAALALDPLSVSAATGTGRLAIALRDADAGVAAATALAELATDAKVKARYLLEGADLLLAADDPRLGAKADRRRRAADLLEKALDSDPDSIPVAGRLASVHGDDGRTDRLMETFRTAIRRATASESIVMLGSEIARLARTERKDLTLAIDAMKRVREVAPQHVGSLLTLAELYISQRAWPEAVEALEAVVKAARDPGPKLTALFALASLYERLLSKPADAERVLRAALGIDPGNARALLGVVRLLRASDRAAVPEVQKEMATLLEKLAEVEPSPEAKRAVLIELAETRLSSGDRAGGQRALVEAAAQCPGADVNARLTAFHTTPQGLDVKGYAETLAGVAKRSEELRRADPAVLATLGQLEIESLGKVAEGVQHLRQAVQLAPALHETRLSLAAGLVRSGQNEEAAKNLLSMMIPDSRAVLALRTPEKALELLERALAAERHGEEALVVRELRATAGGLDDASRAWLRGRRLSPDPSTMEPLDRGTLMMSVMPPEGRHVLVDVAAALAGVENKILRTNLADIGVSSRDRVSARSGHPLRATFDRLMWALRLSDVELALTEAVTTTRTVPQDVPWVIAPMTLLEQPEPVVAASLGRALARIAFGVTWLEDLPPIHAQALLTAAARQVNPGYADDLRDRTVAELVADYEPRVARGIGRKQKRALGELAHRLEGPRGPATAEIEALVNAVARAELRVAFLLTGDLLATLDELRSLDAPFGRASRTGDTRALSAVLSHPLAGDVTRFALTPEATALRWRTGTIWGAGGAPVRSHPPA